jgi:hypothetical protein
MLALCAWFNVLMHPPLQEVPIKQREALYWVGAVEEAMVKGFPFEVPAEYADRPLLMVSVGRLGAEGSKAEDQAQRRPVFSQGGGNMMHHCAAHTHLI